MTEPRFPGKLKTWIRLFQDAVNRGFGKAPAFRELRIVDKGRAAAIAVIDHRRSVGTENTAVVENGVQPKIQQNIRL